MTAFLQAAAFVVALIGAGFLFFGLAPIFLMGMEPSGALLIVGGAAFIGLALIVAALGSLHDKLERILKALSRPR